jgi:EAL domain-containing protein (putative c-di-GMP-specific phosphodiesterase class I)
VVGEGVETAAQFEFLKKHDCDEAQGFHLAKPMPASEFELFAARPDAVGS